MTDFVSEGLFSYRLTPNDGLVVRHLPCSDIQVIDPYELSRFSIDLNHTPDPNLVGIVMKIVTGAHRCEHPAYKIW